jgi:hypothetical protein
MDACPNCTAPREAGAVVCKFCQTPLVRDIASEAVKCLQCGTYSDIRATNCMKCKAWVVVKCVFCGAVSPHHFAACVQCREVFAGAMERWQARKEQAESAQRMELLSGVGSVAVAFLGAAAGAALSSDAHPAERGRGRRRRNRRRDSDDSGSSWLGDANDNDGDDGDDDDEQPGGTGGNLMDSLLTIDDDNRR